MARSTRDSIKDSRRAIFNALDRIDALAFRISSLAGEQYPDVDARCQAAVAIIEQSRIGLHNVLDTL